MYLMHCYEIKQISLRWKIITIPKLFNSTVFLFIYIIFLLNYNIKLVCVSKKKRIIIIKKREYMLDYFVLVYYLQHFVSGQLFGWKKNLAFHHFLIEHFKCNMLSNICLIKCSYHLLYFKLPSLQTL